MGVSVFVDCAYIMYGGSRVGVVEMIIIRPICADVCVMACDTGGRLPVVHCRHGHGMDVCVLRLLEERGVLRRSA